MVFAELTVVTSTQTAKRRDMRRNRPHSCCARDCDVAQFVARRVIAKFHYTDPTGPARTQRSFAAKKVRAGPCGSGRVRVGSVSVSVSV